MSVSVLTLDRRPGKGAPPDSVFEPQRSRTIKHEDAQSFLVTEQGLLYLFPQGPSELGRLASSPSLAPSLVGSALAAYPAHTWFQVSRR